MAPIGAISFFVAIFLCCKSALRRHLRMAEGSRAWLIVFSGFMIGFLCDGIRNSYGILFLEFLREFKESKATTAWIGSIMFGLMNFLGPVTSGLVNMYGCRAVTVAGGLVCAVAYISSVFGTSVYHLYVTMGLLGGVGFSMLVIPFNVIIIQYFQKRRAVAIGIAVCGSGVGSIAFSPLTKIMIDEFGWRGTLLIEGALILHAVPCGLVMKPPENIDEEEETNMYERAKNDKMQPLIAIESHHITNQHKENNGTVCDVDSEYERLHNGEACDVCSDKSDTCDDVEAKNLSGHEKRLNRSRLWDIQKYFNIKLLKNIDFIFVLLSYVFEGLAYSVTFNYLPDMVVSAGYTRFDATMLLSTIAIANTVSRIPVGFLADFKCVNRLNLYMASLCLVGINIIFMGYIKNYVLLTLICVFFGITLGSYVVILPLVLADWFGDTYIADTKGFTLFANGAAGLIGLPIAGALFDATGHYTLTFTLAGTEYIISGLILAFIICHVTVNSKHPKRNKPQTDQV